MLQYNVHPNPSQKAIHLLYTRTLNVQGIPDPSLDPNNLCHHYDALVLKSESDDRKALGIFLLKMNVAIVPPPAPIQAVYSHFLIRLNTKLRKYQCISTISEKGDQLQNRDIIFILQYLVLYFHINL